MTEASEEAGNGAESRGGNDAVLDHPQWQLRAVLLLVLGANCGLIFALLIRGPDPNESWMWTQDPGRLALATFVIVSGILFAFTLERLRWSWSIPLALLGGAVVGGAFYLNGDPDGRSADDGWRFVASLLAVAIAAPLFQTMRDLGTRRLPYVPVHTHAWTNIVLWFSAWGFVLVTWLLLQLLAELFQLIGIGLLRDALRQSWFNWVVVGGALGGAIGLLRDRDRILGLLQRVVTTVLSVLAPVLALGLVLFVLALPFTGLSELWDQTRATTPIVLACVIGAIILINAVLGTAPDEEAKSPVLRYSALALGAVMAPLVLVAGVSTGLRINQHGYTPSRLWAAVFILIAAAFALRYLTSLVRRRLDWGPSVRRQNVNLAVGICLVALLLATPLINFGAISTHDQLGRLRSGRVAPAEFDWVAMRFDFGRSGVRALRDLAQGASTTPEVRRLAREALAQTNAYEARRTQEDTGAAAARARAIRVRPMQVPLPDELRSHALVDRLGRRGLCFEAAECTIFWRPGDRLAIVANEICSSAEGRRQSRPNRATRCEISFGVLQQTASGWATVAGPMRMFIDDAPNRNAGAASPAEAQALERGDVQVREVARRQLFVGGKPVGEPFE